MKFFFSRIEKIMTVFLIFEKIFLKIENLICTLRAYINRTLFLLVKWRWGRYWKQFQQFKNQNKSKKKKGRPNWKMAQNLGTKKVFSPKRERLSCVSFTHTKFLCQKTYSLPKVLVEKELNNYKDWSNART